IGTLGLRAKLARRAQCLLQAGIGFLALSLIPHHLDESVRYSARIARHCQHAARPEPRTILAQVPTLIERATAFYRAPQLGFGRLVRAVLRCEEYGPRLSENVCFRMPGHALRALIPPHHPTVLIEH